MSLPTTTLRIELGKKPINPSGLLLNLLNIRLDEMSRRGGTNGFKGCRGFFHVASDNMNTQDSRKFLTNADEPEHNFIAGAFESKHKTKILPLVLQNKLAIIDAPLIHNCM